MKKFLIIWIGVFLLCSAQARAITCPAGKYEYRNSCKDCPDGSWSESGALSCRSCSYIELEGGSCRACTKDGKKCTGARCSSGYAWNGSTCARLSCPAGQYVSINSCVDCPDGKWSEGGTVGYCWSCSTVRVDNTKCTACTKDGKCTAGQCSGRYMWNGSKCVPRVCAAGQEVYVKTYEFSDDPSTCVACPDGKWSQWSEDGKTTGCLPCSYFISIANGKCTACSSDKTCTAATCNDGYMWNGSACVKLECPAGQYASGNSCVDCPSGKWSAGGTATSTSCQACASIKIKHGVCNACTASGVCTASSCNSERGYGWSDSANACVPLTCGVGQIFGSGSCYDCPSGTYSKGEKTYKEDNRFFLCMTCSSIVIENGKCTDCTKDGTCTAADCNDGYAWNGSACVKLECPAGQYLNGTSCVNCPSDQWSAGGTATACQPCSSISVENGTCVSCSADGGCTTPVCSRKYAFKKGGCVPQICFSNTYEDDSGTCRPCSDIAVNGGVCTACSYDGTVCEKAECNEGWANDTAASCTPTKECSAGGFWDEETQSCKGCDAYTVANGECSECNAAACTKAECDKANMTFSEADQKCGVECAANQYLDASFECKACPSGQYSEGGRSAEATSCSSCSAFAVEGGTCVECSIDSCLKASCSDGYRLDETGKKCVENAARCTDGLFVTSDGCCCTK